MPRYYQSMRNDFLRLIGILPCSKPKPLTIKQILFYHGLRWPSQKEFELNRRDRIRMHKIYGKQ